MNRAPFESFISILIFALTILASQASAADPTFDVIFSFPNSPDEYIGYSTSLSAIDGKIFGVTRNLVAPLGRNVIYSINPDGTNYQVLHSFSYSGPDRSVGQLISVGNRIYGTTSVANTTSLDHLGSIFSMNPDGSDFQTIYSFDGTAGINPLAGLTLQGSKLYGTTSRSGINPGPTVFSIALDGSDFQTVYDFGAGTTQPHFSTSPLTITNGRIYGVSEQGGTNHDGTIFSMNLDGSDFSILHSFNIADGNQPDSELLQVGDRLYGTANEGGPYASGTVFSINLDGSDFQLIHSLGPSGTGGDGAYPVGDLVEIGGRIYGGTLGNSTGSATSINGVPNFAKGTVFSFNPDGTQFEILHQFSFIDPKEGAFTSGLVSIGDSLYGYNTIFGSTPSGGAIFSITVPEWNGVGLAGLGIGLLAFLRFLRGRVAAAK